MVGALDDLLILLEDLLADQRDQAAIAEAALAAAKAAQPNKGAADPGHSALFASGVGSSDRACVSDDDEVCFQLRAKWLSVLVRFALLFCSNSPFFS